MIEFLLWGYAAVLCGTAAYMIIDAWWRGDFTFIEGEDE